MMTLIGIALCGFLLLALVGTEAGRALLKVAVILVIVGVGALYFYIRYSSSVGGDHKQVQAVAELPKCDPEKGLGSAG
jgi:hypothetical protein